MIRQTLANTVPMRQHMVCLVTIMTSSSLDTPHRLSYCVCLVLPGFNDVAHLHSRLHQMEAQVAYLLEQNHMLYQQQQRQEQVMDALVKMMSQVGMASPDTTTATQSLFHVQVPIEQSPPEINLGMYAWHYARWIVDSSFLLWRSNCHNISIKRVLTCFLEVNIMNKDENILISCIFQN